MSELLTKPWPWYVTGPLIGLIVPLLLVVGNRAFGISSSLRHTCAALAPSDIPYFRYDWRSEWWNLLFAGGIIVGAAIAANWLVPAGTGTPISAAFATELQRYGINPQQTLLPRELFNWHGLASLPTLTVTVIGGFLVGFGARYADGCTSGHSITGLATFQRSGLLATLAFMAGGFIMADAILPLLLR